MAKGKHAPNKGALKQAEKVKKVLVMQCSWDSYKRCCILEAEKLGELPKKQLIGATLRSRERLLFSPRILQTANFSIKVGLNRLTLLAEKLSWLREALPGVEDEDGKVGCLSEYVIYLI